jgi:hypothetical protein
VVGRISLFDSSPAGTPWMWSIEYNFHEDREVIRGFSVTREAAMQAFARSWHRKT